MAGQVVSRWDYDDSPTYFGADFLIEPLLEQIRKTGSISWDETYFSDPFRHEHLPYSNWNLAPSVESGEVVTSQPVEPYFDDLVNAFVGAQVKARRMRVMKTIIMLEWAGPIRSMINGEMFNDPESYIAHLMANDAMLVD